MSSGWHLHQSLNKSGSNAFTSDKEDLSELGKQYLTGLLAHARGPAALATPTINGYKRYRPYSLAPDRVIWGKDNRGAMLRVIGGPRDANTRIENRIGEPAANPYLYFASQVHAGLDGIERKLKAPPATDAPYAETGTRLPTTLSEALAALREDKLLVAAFGDDFVRYFIRIKQMEADRFDAAEDKDDFQRREYFSRI